MIQTNNNERMSIDQFYTYLIFQFFRFPPLYNSHVFIRYMFRHIMTIIIF